MKKEDNTMTKEQIIETIKEMERKECEMFETLKRKYGSGDAIIIGQRARWGMMHQICETLNILT